MILNMTEIFAYILIKPYDKLDARNMPISPLLWNYFDPKDQINYKPVNHNKFIEFKKWLMGPINNFSKEHNREINYEPIPYYFFGDLNKIKIEQDYDSIESFIQEEEEQRRGILSELKNV